MLNSARISELLHELSREFQALAVQPEYYDQNTSPLGRRRHLELARQGAFPFAKDGRRVLVLVADVRAFLAAKRVVPIREKYDDQTAADMLIQDMTRSGNQTKKARRK
jgi:hypothetical protein